MGTEDSDKKAYDSATNFSVIQLLTELPVLLLITVLK